jgi:hypothetical protein
MENSRSLFYIPAFYACRDRNHQSKPINHKHAPLFMKKCPALLCLFFLLLYSVAASAQINTGQWLLNGDLSFFNNHSSDERTVSEKTISGEVIPMLTYDFQQYVHNLTLNPAAHYFLSPKWSAGGALGFRQIITNRFVKFFEAETSSTYIAFNIPAISKNTTYSYAPKAEIGRHWNVNQKFAISLYGALQWQWVTLLIEDAEALPLTKVSELNTWRNSNNGLTYTSEDPLIEKEKSNVQNWIAISSRFGLSATLGGIQLSQRIKDDSPTFVKAKPDWSVDINPRNWAFGVYGVLGK